ncbi:MAG: type II secretion system F family protein [Deferribacteraceae bacterium]|jgi:type II secretory pathway component PulF|nr:type II secretion system F family protein [Deferribacteraceae bacterium]
MVSYRLFYLNDKGKRLKKIIELNDESQLQSFLGATYLNILKIEQLPSSGKIWNFQARFEKVSKKQVIEILENLQTAAVSGVPPNTALLDMAKSADNVYMSDMLTDISYRMQMSMSMSRAMEKYDEVFDGTVLGLIKIGEETGELDKTLKGAADYLLRINKMGDKIKMAVVIPAFTLAAMLTAVIFWMTVVMPGVKDLFEILNVKLPTITLIFLRMSEIVKANLFYIIITVFCAVVLFIAARRKNENFRYETEKLFLEFPVLGRLLKYYNFAFIAEYTRLMISSGVPLFHSLEILTGALKNTVFIRSVINIRNEMEAGKSFSVALSGQNIFSPMIIRMIGMGEYSGQLEKQLKYVSDYYYEKADYMSANIAQIIQPVLILFLAAFFVLMILSFLFPIYDMISIIGGSV